MKVFVTGGSGQVGSTVIDMLLARGDEVLAIDNFATGRRDNLEPHPRLQLVEDTIVDAARGRRADRRFPPRCRDPYRRVLQGPGRLGGGRADQLRRQRQHRARPARPQGRPADLFPDRAVLRHQAAASSRSRSTIRSIRSNSSYAISKTAGEHYIQF